MGENNELLSRKKYLPSGARGMRGLEDLTAEDILACKGAERIAGSFKNHDVNDGREVIEMQGNTGYHWCMT